MNQVRGQSPVGCTDLDVGRVGIDCLDESAFVSAAAEGVGARVLDNLQARSEREENRMRFQDGVS